MEHIVGFNDRAGADAIREKVTAMPGNEDALASFPPSNDLVDLNVIDMDFKGAVPLDVIQALFAGALKGGLPAEFSNPEAVALSLADVA